MMMKALLLVGVFAALNTQHEFCHGFVPLLGGGLPRPSALWARQLLPPPPPPPKPPVDDDLFGQLLKKFDSVSLDDITFQIPDLKDVRLPIANIAELQKQIGALESNVGSELSTIATEFQASLIEKFPQSEQLLNKFSVLLSPIIADPLTQMILSAFLTYVVVSKVLSFALPPPPNQPYPLGRYDADAARAYFDQRLPMVVFRGLEAVTQSLQFGISLLQDKLQDKIAENEYQRGEELAELLSRLGPTFIKVGQSLSIRTDLLSPAYVRGLASLTDQVKAFDTDIAREILEQEWGQPVSSVIEGDLTPEPIAAASLGQVYKAKLKSTGQDVAIKVQRPNIGEQIALDMHLLREIAPVVKRTFNLNSDTAGTVDAWGTGFVDELDYLQEARNAEEFSARIVDTPLSDVVFAPTVVNEFSTQSVLVSEWVEGERLDETEQSDVTVLCSIAMNTYLTMMLEFGNLHSDPHTGNLLRTPEGKLCILDWGMMTRLDDNLQLTLIEHMAHLTSADYEEIPRDLLLLGFIPEEKAGEINDSGVVEVLADIYGAWTKGGGAAAINVNDVVNQLQDLTAEKGNLFQIPPYFAYIAKCFSVLEGIGLSNDPKYSIINECLPYVSKRLLTDKENMGPALSTFIFGPDKSNADRIVDYKRVKQLVEGFGDYSTSASGALLGKDELSPTEVLEEAAEQVLDLLVTENETALQDIFLEQMAKIITSNSRSVWTQIRERSGTLPSGRTVLGTVVDPLGLFRTSPLVRMNELDERTIDTTEKLIALAQDVVRKSDNPMFDLSNLSRQESLEFSRILVKKVWERRSGLLQTSGRFAGKLLQLTAEKLEVGERDTRVLPAHTSLVENQLTEAQEPARIVESHESPKDDSARLIEARRRLDTLQTETNEVLR